MLQHKSSTYLYNPYLKPYVAFLDKVSQPNSISVDGDEKTHGELDLESCGGWGWGWGWGVVVGMVYSPGEWYLWR